MRALRCSAPPSIWTTWRPNLSTSPLNGLHCYVRTKEGPGESYLPGPRQRLFTGFSDRVAQGGRGHHTPSIGYEPLARIKLRASMEDQPASRNLGQSSDRKAQGHCRVIGVVRRRDDDGDGSSWAPAQVRKVRQRALR